MKELKFDTKKIIGILEERVQKAKICEKKGHNSSGPGIINRWDLWEALDFCSYCGFHYTRSTKKGDYRTIPSRDDLNMFVG